MDTVIAGLVAIETMQSGEKDKRVAWGACIFVDKEHFLGVTKISFFTARKFLSKFCTDVRKATATTALIKSYVPSLLLLSKNSFLG